MVGIWGWVIGGIAVAALVLTTAIVWARRTASRREPALAILRGQVGELVRLPGRLRRLAADPRTPRRARWWLLGLALYVASPVDPIPDFLPGVGFLDELVVVPLVLDRVRRLIPPEAWADHFPPRRASVGTAPVDVSSGWTGEAR